MLTPEELTALRNLVERATADAATANTAGQQITPGDLVQLRPGACDTWETSFMLVKAATGNKLRGAILQPHRSGCQEAWWTYSRAELARVGHAPYLEPARDIRAWCYDPPCPLQEPDEKIRAAYRRMNAAMFRRLIEEEARCLAEAKKSRSAARPAPAPAKSSTRKPPTRSPNSTAQESANESAPSRPSGKS